MNTHNTIASVSQFNNSWYKGDSGERPEHLTRGKIADDRPPQKPAWDLQDKYTKSRNPANDRKRYTYIDDCTDEIRRDVSLRFAVPPHMTQRERGTVLPELKTHRPSQSAQQRTADSQRFVMAASPQSTPRYTYQ